MDRQQQVDLLRDSWFGWKSVCSPFSSSLLSCLDFTWPLPSIDIPSSNHQPGSHPISVTRPACNSFYKSLNGQQLHIGFSRSSLIIQQLDPPRVRQSERAKERRGEKVWSRKKSQFFLYPNLGSDIPLPCGIDSLEVLPDNISSWYIHLLLKSLAIRNAKIIALIPNPLGYERTLYIAKSNEKQEGLFLRNWISNILCQKLTPSNLRLN